MQLAVLTTALVVGVWSSMRGFMACSEWGGVLGVGNGKNCCTDGVCELAVDDRAFGSFECRTTGEDASNYDGRYEQTYIIEKDAHQLPANVPCTLFQPLSMTRLDGFKLSLEVSLSLGFIVTIILL